MFDDLDATLRTVLSDAAAPPEVRTAEVSFDTPDRDFAPTQATVNLFLHEVLENRAVRDPVPVRRTEDGAVLSRRAPVRVDCGYLVTAWSSKAGGLKAQEEHRLLGSTLLWLSRFPVLEEPFLQGSLRPPDQPFRVPMTVAQTREGEQLAHFWSALGIAPRPAFSVAVTVGLQPFPEPDSYPQVAAVQLEPVLRTAPVLTGRVLDRALVGVPGAAVSVVGADRETTTGTDGRFRFGDLRFGAHTLRVRAPGHPDLDVPVEYRADRQVHNAIVPDP
jgi:hypothetical protein